METKESLNELVAKVNGYEIDRLKDQDNWDGVGGQVYHVFKSGRFVEECTDLGEAYEYCGRKKRGKSGL